MGKRSRRATLVLIALVVVLISHLAVPRVTARRQDNYRVAIFVVDNFEAVEVEGYEDAEQLGIHSLFYLYHRAKQRAEDEGVPFPDEWGLGDIETIAQLIRTWQDILPPPSKDACAIHLPEIRGSGDYDLDGSSTLEQFGIPHGEGVRQALDEFMSDPSYASVPLLVDCATNDTGTCVKNVEISWKLDDIVTELKALKTTVDQMLISFDTIPRYVVNMSFTAVPCDTVETFAAYVQYIADVDKKVRAGQADISDLNDAINALADYYVTVITIYFGMDSELYIFFDTEWPLVVPVAASGNWPNTNLPYPFYPAAWDRVVSVSASEDDGSVWNAQSSLANYSNAGEVMMGGHLVFNHPNLGPLDLDGTSFAAPRLSAAIAYYLYRGLYDYGSAFDVCTHVAANGNESMGLAYIDDWTVFPLPPFNLPINDAAADHCEGMEEYLP